MSAAQYLTLPLIGTLPHHEVEACVASHEHKLESGSSYMDHATTVCLPVLLFLQFGIAFQAYDGEIDGVQWSVVSLSIVLFTLATFLYGKVMADAGVDCVASILLPEYIVVTVVVLSCFHRLFLAYAVLVGGVLTLALVVVICSVYLLLAGFGDDKLELSSSHDRKLDAFVV